MGAFGIGPLELLVVLMVALLVFGPEKLPEMAGKLGKAIRDFRQMTAGMTAEVGKLTAEMQDITLEVGKLTAEMQDVTQSVVQAVGMDDIKQSVSGINPLADIQKMVADATTFDDLKKALLLSLDQAKLNASGATAMAERSSAEAASPATEVSLAPLVPDVEALAVASGFGVYQPSPLSDEQMADQEAPSTPSGRRRTGNGRWRTSHRLGNLPSYRLPRPSAVFAAREKRTPGPRHRLAS